MTKATYSMMIGHNNMRESGVIWRVLVVLIGLLALMIGYYIFHKPIDLGLLFTFGGAALDLATVGLVAAIAGGLGRRGLVLFDGISRVERVAMECGVGLGLISIIMLALGMIGLLNPLVLWVMIAVLGIVALPGIRGWLSDCRILVCGIRPATPWTQFLAIFLLLSLITALLLALAPPTAWDSLMYHLVGPKHYLADGRILAHTENHYLGFPQGVEMLFTLTMGLFGRDTVPIHFLLGVLALLAAGGITRRYADENAGWLAMVLLLSSYSIWLLFGWAYVDLGVMAYALLALIAITRWRETQSEKWLLLAGIFAGLLIGVKYTSGLMLIALGVYALYHAPRRIARNGLILGMAALIVFFPWMIRGFLLYQNPVYPFFFGGLNWDPMRDSAFQVSGGLLESAEAWQLIVLPIAATIFGAEKGPGFSFTLGPWLLTAPLLVLVGWRWLDDRARSLASSCLLLIGVMLIFWIILSAKWVLGMSPRQMSALVALSSVAGALGFHSLSRWPRKPFDLYFIARGILAFTLILGMLEMLQTTVRSRVIPYFFTTISRDAYLDGEIGLYMGAMRQLDSLPDDSSVQFLWEPRAYYCPVTCSADVLTDAWSYPLRNGAEPDDIFADWGAEGIDYVLVFDLGYNFYTYEDRRFVAENMLFPDALERWMTPVWSDNFAYTLYVWRETD
jgi:Dolichyl-phosphate-mannose-protein mannosyltransferase